MTATLEVGSRRSEVGTNRSAKWEVGTRNENAAASPAEGGTLPASDFRVPTSAFRLPRSAFRLSTLLCLASSALAESPPEMTVRELSAIMNERERANGQRFEAQEKAVASALAAAKEAVIKAEASAEKRFDSVNEFRNTLKDQQQNLIMRNEADVRFKSVEDKIASLENRQNRMSGSTEGANWLWGVLVGLAALLIAVAAFIRSRFPIRAYGQEGKLLLLLWAAVLLPGCTVIREKGQVVFSSSSNLAGVNFRSAGGSTLVAERVDNSTVHREAGKAAAAGAVGIGAGVASSGLSKLF